MNYLLLAGVVALALVLGYIVGRTAEAVSRERADICEVFDILDTLLKRKYGVDRRDIERGATHLTDVRWEDEDVYAAYEREARKRGKGV